MSTIAISLASYPGSRFRSETPKQFLQLAGKTMLEHTLDVFTRPTVTAAQVVPD